MADTDKMYTSVAAEKKKMQLLKGELDALDGSKADKATVAAGSYNKVTVNSQGIVTAGENPTTLAGHGIQDAYTKTEVNGLVDTPHQNYVTVQATAQTTAATDVLPASGQAADTIYRVSNWDGSANSFAGAFDVTCYSEYAWDDVSNPNKYVFLAVKTQIGEVFDISVYNNNATYPDLSAALGTNGANVPADIRRGGMRVQFVHSVDNNYVQFRYMPDDAATVATFTNVANWQGVDVEPKDGSKDFVESGGIYRFSTVLIGAIDESDAGTVLQTDGTVISSGTTNYVYKYAITSGIYSCHGRVPQGTDKCGIAYYDENNNFISYEIQGNENDAYIFHDYILTIPTNAKYVKIQGNVSFGGNLPRLYGTISTVNGDLNEVKSSISGILEGSLSIAKNNVVVASTVYDGKRINSSGVLENTTSSGATVHEFSITQGNKYLASGYSPSISSGNLFCAYYDANDNYIRTESESELKIHSAAVEDFKLSIPNNAAKVRVFGRSSYQPELQQEIIEYVNVDELQSDVEELQQDTDIPQIVNNPIYRRAASDSIKILCFGSSWFMDTWWYLNKIIQSAGINAELHCYYIGHSKFDEWIELYKNDLTPFSGSEETRSASKNISINGADWTITTYRSNYTSQQFRDDWYNDLISEDWDIVAFQQGARQAPYWNLYWKNSWSELVEIVKTHCNPNTVIAFNSTWTPAVQDSAELSPWPATKEGQMGWQEANWKSTKKFMKLSGIYNVSPNGKTMYLLRDSELNTETDLADDGLHPNNGLPIYALGGTFFETYIAPMFGISFKTVEWLPTESTQKASVSGSTWTPVSSSDSIIVKSIIRQSLGDRFDF